MKHTNQILFSLLMLCITVATVTYTSCKKDPCKNVNCLNGGFCNQGSCICPSGYTGIRCETKATTTIAYRNNAFTPITIVMNGITKVIPVGGEATYTGQYGTTITGTASTYQTYASGTGKIGITVYWTLSNSFPSNGTFTEPMDLGTSVFFLRVKNMSAHTVGKIYVNYGITGQTLDNVTIPNDGVEYNVGYYSAYANSTYRLESTLMYWYGNLNLLNIKNQVKTVTIN